MSEFSNYTAIASRPFDIDMAIATTEDFRRYWELDTSVSRWAFNAPQKPCELCGHKMRAGAGPMGETIYVCEHRRDALKQLVPQREASGPLMPLHGIAIQVESPGDTTP